MRAGEEPAGTDSQLAAGQKETRQNLSNSPLMAKNALFCLPFQLLPTAESLTGFLMQHEKWKQEGIAPTTVILHYRENICTLR